MYLTVHHFLARVQSPNCTNHGKCLRERIMVVLTPKSGTSKFQRSQFCRLKPKKICYRNFKNFNEKKFLEEVKNTDFIFISDNRNENYEVITDVFSSIVEKHAPLKKGLLRGNQTPFITKEFRKAIYNRSRLRNKTTEENEKLYKKQRDRCISIRKKSIRNYINKIVKVFYEHYINII